MNKNSCLILISLLLFSLVTKAQEFRYTGNSITGTANPLQLNPAFAGSENVPRLAIGASLYDGIFTRNLNISYDQYIKNLRGGISVRANASPWGGQINGGGHTHLSIGYSPKFTAGKMFTFAPVFEFGFTKSAYSIGKYSDHLSSNIGILLNTKNSYIGAYTSLMTDHGIIKSSFQCGHTVDLNQNLKLSVDGQYVREQITSIPYWDPWNPSQSINMIAQSYLVTTSLRYKQLKLTVGANFNQGRSMETSSSHLRFVSSINPMIGLGYYGKRFNVQGNMISKQSYSSSYEKLFFQSNETRITSEIVASYTFKR